MLQGNFFKITSMEKNVTDIQAVLEINEHHAIFEGHFPGQPVVPGVCMMQIIKELLETATLKKFNILQANEMKFLAIINPIQNNIVQAQVKYTILDSGKMMVNASLFSPELTYFKFKAFMHCVE